MTKSSLGAGDVKITILGNEYTLKPTLLAAKTISKDFGGGFAAMTRLSQLDFDAFVKVIAVGLTLTDTGKQKFADGKGLEEAIFETGVVSLSADCIRFVHIVMNGGKPPVDVEEGGEEGPLDNA